MMLGKLADLLADKRNPLFLFRNRKERAMLREQLGMYAAKTRDGPVTLDVALTFDVERDFGSVGTGSAGMVGPFLGGCERLLGKLGAKATFFVQGNLVHEHAAQLKKLSDAGHEIGLHAWAHEAWGDAWFTRGKAPDNAESAELLKRSMEAFREAGLPRPLSFRAPDMVLNPEKVRLLENEGFIFDSSKQSYRDPIPLVSKLTEKVTEVPVSVDPIPRRVFPKADYTVLNMRNLADMGAVRMAEACGRAVQFQELHGQAPHLVFLSHPWEYFPNGLFGYCAESNYGLLDDLVAGLGKKYALRYRRIRDFSWKAADAGANEGVQD